MKPLFLTKTQKKVLRALINGWTLKSHRYLDGRKEYQLHPLDGPAQPVNRLTVEILKTRRLVGSNQKFPAATFLLTEKGKRVAAKLDEAPAKPLSARNF